jgi:DNA-binding transcriptional regulator YiaG
VVDIKRDKENPKRLVFVLGRESWHISRKEAAHLYKKLKAYRVYDEGLGTIGSRIRKYREDHRLTMFGLAYKLGVSRMQVHRWEKGKSVPGALSLKLLRQKGVL